MVRNIIVVNDFGKVNGGAGKVAYMEARGLASAGYNVIWFCATEPDMNLFDDYGIKVVCTHQYDIAHDPSRLNAVIQGCWNKKAYDNMLLLLNHLDISETIVHIHCFSKALSASVMAAAANANTKICYTLHDYFAFCPNGGLYNYQSKKICHLKPGAMKCFFCNCDARSFAQKMFRNVRQLFVKKSFYRARKNLNIISIGKINEKVSKPPLYRYTSNWFYLRNPIEINQKDVVNIVRNNVYLFIARLSSEKGIDLFCEAITQLGLKGCVLGDGYLLNEYKKKYPLIEFAGWVSGEKKDSLIRKGKCLVFPSLWYEGAPLTVIEMKSFGIPCIVPDECAASEEIEDSVSGFVFKTGNLESLKEAIVKFETTDLNLLQCRLIAGFDAEVYSETTHLKNLVDVYNKVLCTSSLGLSHT